MFALVLFVCYLDGGCDDIVIDVYNTEWQCVASKKSSEFAMAVAILSKILSTDSGHLHRNTATFNYCN